MNIYNTRKNVMKWFAILLVECCAFNARAATSTTITILHTNDLHSHFRAENNLLNLGGVARIKSAVESIRYENPNTLLVDAGDWSEGSIYYNENAGIESLKMMGQIGYDVAVIGNHDWLNGPDSLLKLFDEVNPKTTFLSANLDLDSYSQRDYFRNWILPYTIREVAGVKIAFIGLSTYEFIYDKFFKPIKITEPFLLARRLAADLKSEHKADFVIAISHNSIFANKAILRAAPKIDLLISGHQHEKLTSPIVINHLFHPSAWLVEADSWGRYLGRVNLTVENGKVSLSDYKLIPIDRTIPEDPTVLATLDHLESKLEQRYGPVFHDSIAKTEIEISRSGLNSDMGNLVVDSYLKFTSADFAIENSEFIYAGLHPGVIRTADILNSNPAIFNPNTQKTWTLKTLPISGRTLKWLLYGIYTSKKIGNKVRLSTSGLQYTYDPLFFQNQIEMNNNLQSQLLSFEPFDQTQVESIPVVKNIMIQGVPLDLNKTYTLASGGGLIEALEFIDEHIYNGIPLDQIHDTQIENWRILKEYIHFLNPLNIQKIPRNGRIQSLQSDLGVYANDIEWLPIKKTKDGMLAIVQVRITNYGATDSKYAIVSNPTDDEVPQLREQEQTVEVLFNENGKNLGNEEILRELDSPKSIHNLKPGESEVFSWEVTLPRASQNLYSVTVRINSGNREINLTNNKVTRWFQE